MAHTTATTKKRIFWVRILERIFSGDFFWCCCEVTRSIYFLVFVVWCQKEYSWWWQDLLKMIEECKNDFWLHHWLSFYVNVDHLSDIKIVFFLHSTCWIAFPLDSSFFLLFLYMFNHFHENWKISFSEIIFCCC